MFTIVILILNAALIVETTSKEEKSLAEVTLRNANESDPTVLHLDVEAFGNLYHFNLVPAPKIFHPQLTEFFAGLDENGTSSLLRAMDKQSDHVKMMEKLYTDKTGHAAVHVEEINGHIYVEGTLAENMRIFPSGMENTMEAPIHIVYRQVKPDPLTNETCKTITHNMTFPVDSTPAEERTLPSLIQPELLIVLDYQLSKHFDFKVNEVRKYLGIFFNSVNNRYATIYSPKIQMVVNSIVLTTHPMGNPYVVERNSGANADKTIDGLGKWAYKYRFTLKENYDIALLLTDYLLNSGNSLENSVGGIAILSGVCLAGFKSQLKVALTKDLGGVYRGVIAATHELAHSLGAAHDGDSNDSPPGNPGATRCPWDDGYVMSYVDNEANNNRFSRCSINQMDYTIKSSQASCLMNNPATILIEVNNQPLPGEKIGLDEQCRAIYGQHSYFHSDINEVCERLWCSTGSFGQLGSRGPAFDGSPCSQHHDSGWCINGRCVQKKRKA